MAHPRAKLTHFGRTLLVGYLLSRLKLDRPDLIDRYLRQPGGWFSPHAGAPQSVGHTLRCYRRALGAVPFSWARGDPEVIRVPRALLFCGSARGGEEDMEAFGIAVKTAI